VEETLHQAEGLEKEYDWCGVAKCYEKAIGLMSAEDSSRMSEAQERLGYASYRAAFQVENNNEFMERMRQAVAAYENARKFYGRLNGSAKTPRILRCDAMIAYMGYWLASEVPEKKRLINECWKLTKESLKTFEEAGAALEYGKTYNQLSASACFGFFFERDLQPRERVVREAIERGERAIQFLSKLEDSHELVKALVRTAGFLEVFGYYFLDSDDRERSSERAKSCWERAKELSEMTAMIELLCILGAPSLSWGVGTDETLAIFDKALEYAGKTKDRFIVGCALEWLSLNTFWKVSVIEDPDERMEFGRRALQYAEDAKRHYSLVSFISPLGDVLWVEAPYTEYYQISAGAETNLAKRRQLLEKAVETAPDTLRRAENSGIPQNMLYAHHVFAKVLASLALTETDSDEKKRLLEKALMHRKESIEFTELLGPFDYWNRGVMQSYLAEIKSGLADLSKDNETKKSMLQEAILDKENSLKLCIKGVAFFGGRGPSAQLWNIAFWQIECGTWLKRLYQLTHNNEDLRKAIGAFENAAETSQKAKMESGMAWCYWKAAQAYDDLGEHPEAAKRFILAASNFRNAADKIPQLKDLYHDQALYMQAWSEIEEARHHHERQEYAMAKEHFQKAAELHKPLKKWNYLVPNYSAWARVENAEELSRKEQSEEAIKAFEDAATLFGETRDSLQTQLNKIEDTDEKQMVSSMIKASDLRQDYCDVRIALEEAKILDKKGNHYSSSEKYGSAAEAFEKIGQALESEQERREFRFIINLSRAWQKMTLAEAESAPALFLEASQLFEQAKDFSPNEKTKMLVLGHSRFCRALEAGTRFADTADATLHATAIQQLESAAKYYVRAEFQNASEYARATKLLFDAYLYMDNAGRESDPEKKAKLYVMAEKVLQTSAGSYMKAEHPEKMEQVSKLLEKTKEERELATSLTEVLHAPPILSTTKAFTIPTPTSEEAVGSERFENADIQANLIVRQKELKIGEPLSLEIELVNAGKGPALLIKINEAIPEGFELIEKPETCRVEDSFINMKGKRLDPLKTEEVKLILKPKVQGTFTLKPTILYLDENGKYKSHEPEPINITVKELGIKGWLKGER
jgi:tetratricopeptide (TPR) repeat protein